MAIAGQESQISIKATLGGLVAAVPRAKLATRTHVVGGVASSSILRRRRRAYLGLAAAAAAVGSSSRQVPGPRAVVAVKNPVSTRRWWSRLDGVEFWTRRDHFRHRVFGTELVLS